MSVWGVGTSQASDEDDFYDRSGAVRRKKLAKDLQSAGGAGKGKGKGGEASAEGATVVESAATLCGPLPVCWPCAQRLALIPPPAPFCTSLVRCRWAKKEALQEEIARLQAAVREEEAKQQLEV